MPKKMINKKTHCERLMNYRQSKNCLMKVEYKTGGTGICAYFIVDTLERLAAGGFRSIAESMSCTR